MNKQQGNVLLLTVVFLSVISVTSIVSMQSNILETKIINNIQNKQTAYHSSYGLLENFFTEYSGTQLIVREQLDILVKSGLDQNGLPAETPLIQTLTIPSDLNNNGRIKKTSNIHYSGLQKSYVNNEYNSMVFTIRAESKVKNSSIESVQILSFRKLAPKSKNKL